MTAPIVCIVFTVSVSATPQPIRPQQLWESAAFARDTVRLRGLSRRKRRSDVVAVPVQPPDVQAGLRRFRLNRSRRAGRHGGCDELLRASDRVAGVAAGDSPLASPSSRGLTVGLASSGRCSWRLAISRTGSAHTSGRRWEFGLADYDVKAREALVEHFVWRRAAASAEGNADRSEVRVSQDLVGVNGAYEVVNLLEPAVDITKVAVG
jgi:hypothetical protein